MNIKYSVLPQPRNDGMKYILDEEYVYYSSLFNRTKTIPKGRMSDGATSARDLGVDVGNIPMTDKIVYFVRMLANRYLPKRFHQLFGPTDSWWIHDEFCIDPFWDDGYPVTNIIASMIICARLHVSGYLFEAYTWFLPTFLFGGKHIKKMNGWIWIKED